MYKRHAYMAAAQAEQQRLIPPANVVRAGANVIYLYGFIDAWFGISAEAIISALADMKGALTVRINSGGGDVFEAIAIAAALQRYGKEKGKVTTSVDALAASAATLVAMSGDVRTMSEAAQYMIHQPWMMTAGNADDLRSMAAMLDNTEVNSMLPYYRRSGMSDADLRAAMAAETWYSAAEAKTAGFVSTIDTITENTKTVDQRRASHMALLYQNFHAARLQLEPRHSRVRHGVAKLPETPEAKFKGH